MGALKDVVDLTTQLANSVQDRKIAEELNKIQSLTLSLQSEQISLHETNIALREEKLSLNETIQALESKIRELEVSFDAERNSLREQLEKKESYVFKKPFYYKEGDSQPFCPSCYEEKEKSIHLMGPESFAGGTGYKCEVCERVFFTSRIRENYRDSYEEDEFDRYRP